MRRKDEEMRGPLKLFIGLGITLECEPTNESKPLNLNKGMAQITRLFMS